MLNDVMKEAHDKETKLLKKIHTQEQKLRQHEHDLRSKDDKVLALRVEIADLKCKIDEFPGHLQSSTDSCKYDVLNKELDEMKKENARLRKQVEAFEELYAITGQEDNFDIVDKRSEVLVQKGEDIAALQDQIDEYRDGAYKAKQLQDHSQLQSKHVMELKQELGATQV